MSKPLRILISIGAGLISLVISILFYLAFLEDEGISTTLGAGTAVAIMFYTYKKIKPTERELREDHIESVANFYSNGIARERGKLILGKKDGIWDYFNEEGVLIREDVYKDGELIQSINHKS